MDRRSKWLLVLVVYFAPADALDWDGPWEFGVSHLVEETFTTEAECRNSAIERIGRLHQGMLAPVRYRCIEFASDLPKGAAR